MKTTKNHKILVPAFLVFSQLILAQNIKGIITDEEGKPVRSAIIKVENTSILTNSDQKGKFSFDLKGQNYNAIINAIGFETKIIDLSKEQNDTINISLKSRNHLIDEVVITANKRDESYLHIPSAISVISVNKIKDTETRSLSNLVGLIPNMQYAEFGVPYQQMVALRGVSIFSETPSIATYVDGVNATDVSGNGFQLMDVERIEVLRGPQGTLYGRNAMAGVINIITNKPTNITTGFVEASSGNQGLQRYGFGVKTPLKKDKFFFGISGQYQYRDGFYYNDLSKSVDFITRESLAGTPEDGKRMGDAESYYANMYLKWTPSQNWNIILNSKFQNDHSVGASAYYQGVENNTIAIQNPYKFAVNDLGSDSRTVLNNSLTVNYYHPKFNIISTTAYQYTLQKYNGIDQDLWPYNVSAGYTFREKLGDGMPQNNISQELRISSPNKKQNFNWTVGTYIFNQKYDKRFAAVYKDLSAFFGVAPGEEFTVNDQDNLGISGFAQADYTVDRFTVTAGYRFDHERRKTFIERYRLDQNAAKVYSVNPKDLESEFNNWSPKFSLQYNFSDRQMVYGSYSKGFRAGGNNFYANDQYISYKPEFSDNYELGYKYQNTSGTFTLSSALFFLEWTNMQLDTMPEKGVWIVDNIGKMRSWGLEIEGNAKPLKGMNIDFSLGLNKTEYIDFEYLDINIQGNQGIMAPEKTAMFGLQQSFPIHEKLNMTARAEWRHVGKQYFDLTNTIEQPAYNLMNTKVTFSSRNYDLAFWVQNLLEEKYITYAMPGYFKYTILNRPRTFGGTLTLKF